MRVAARLWLLCALAQGCRDPEVHTLSSKLSLRTLPGCTPALAEQIVVEPLGDFALGEQGRIASELSSAVVLLSNLPVAAQLYRLSVETQDFRGAALGPAADQGERFDALLLPVGRACTVLDAALPSFAGSGLALVAGSDLWIAGGLDENGVTQDSLLLRVAEPSLELYEGVLNVPRAYATAVASGYETWLLGGVVDERAGTQAFDSFDRFDAVSHSIVGLGRMRVGRKQPAAARTNDGSIVVAGGVSANAGRALSSLETIAADGKTSTLWDESLPFAAERVSLLPRDDGTMLMLGQQEAGLRMVIIDPRVRGVGEQLAPSGVDPTWLDARLVVTLPGERSALLERDPSSDKLTGRLLLLLPGDEQVVFSDPSQPGSGPSWLASFAGTEQARVLALSDGRILLTGVRAEQREPIARILDPGNRDVAVRPLDLVVDALFMRADGSVLMVGPSGARVFREDARTRFDNPGGTLLADDSTALCLDAYGRFQRDGLALRATVPGARFQLAQLRYRNVRIELSVDGEANLLLRREDGDARSIALGEKFGPVLCQLSIAESQPLQIERSEERVTMRAGKLSKSCQLEGLTGPIALGLQALTVGTTVRDLRITRE